MDKQKKIFEVLYYSWVIKNGHHEYRSRYIRAFDLADARRVFEKHIDCRGIDAVRECGGLSFDDVTVLEETDN